MRAYDLVVIYRPATEDAVLEEEIDKVSSLVKNSGGETVEINRWGKKPLGYEIGGERTGIYVVFKFRGESSLLPEINKELGLNENVLRQRVLVSPHAAEDAVAEEPEAEEEEKVVEEKSDPEVE